MLCACLSAIQSLGPDLTDLLCGPGIDVGAWTLFFHPSFRPVSAHDPAAQPSLASLTAVLELYDSHASKVIYILFGRIFLWLTSIGSLLTFQLSLAFFIIKHSVKTAMHPKLAVYIGNLLVFLS